MVEERSNSDNTFIDPDSIEVMTKMYLSSVKSILDSLEEYEGDGSAADIMYLLAQAQARWLSSSLRYWQQIAAIVSARGIESIKPDGTGESAQARRVRMLDKARAALREVSTLSLREAKLLQKDLLKIEAELRACMVSTDDDLGAPRRFGRIVK